MAVLAQGANTAIAAAAIRVAMDWPTGAGELDGSAYLLTAAGKVRGDQDMVFYNQPNGGDGAVRVAAQAAGRIAFDIELNAMPAAIDRIVFCLTAEGRTMAAYNGAALAVTADGANLATFAPDIAGASETAMIIAELYRRSGQWKLRAVAQGFNGGLAPLARSFGIDVAEPAPPPPPPPVVAAPAAPSPTGPPPSVNLSKITLDKTRPTVSLEKRGEAFGEILINLNWSAGKVGFFGGSKKIDLDLGCLFELSDGRKGIVQALGNSFGAVDSPPYIELSGDDRTGAVAAGETIRVNGRKWSEISRIALYAYIYDGAPNWKASDGVVTITMRGQPPIEIRLDDGENNRGFCGLALIENVGGTMKFSRLIEYFRDHAEFDRRVGWGLRWTAGRKS